MATAPSTGKGKGPLRIAFEDFIQTFPFVTIFQDWYKTFKEALEAEYISVLGSLINEILAVEGVPADIRAVFINLLSGKHQIGEAVMSSMATGAAGGAVNGLLAPIFTLMNYAINRKVHASRPDIAAIVDGLRRGYLKTEDFNTILDELGYDDRDKTAIFLSTQAHLPTENLVRLLFRFPDARARYLDMIQKNGFSEHEVDDLLEALKLRPTLGDVLSFADKFAYDDHYSEQFTRDQLLASQSITDAAKLGYEEADVKLWWRAHWQEPGIGQVFEMLHRLRPDRSNVPVTDDTVKEWLKGQPLAPFWHERLIEISYTPLTRVDIRRIYKAGLIDAQGVKNAYLDDGYNQRDADIITRWITQEANTDQQELSRSAIQTGYKDKLIDHTTAYNMLRKIGYDDFEANYWLNIVDYNDAQETQKAEINRIEFLYVEGELADNEAHNELNKLALPASQIDKLFQVWKVKKSNKISLATGSELADLYEQNIIDLNTFKTNLAKRGYPADRIDWTVKKTELDLAAKQAKAVQDAQDALAKQQASQRKSEYERLRSEYELQIALDKQQIVDLKIARTNSVDPTEQQTYGTNIQQLTSDIAAIQVAIANLKRELYSGLVLQ